MSAESDAYWLSLSVQEFCKCVWQRGLSKFSLDKDVGEEADKYIYGEYSIVVSRNSETALNISLESATPLVAVILVFSIAQPTEPIDIIYGDADVSVVLIEDICGLWAEGLFRLSPAN